MPSFFTLSSSFSGAMDVELGVAHFGGRLVEEVVLRVVEFVPGVQRVADLRQAVGGGEAVVQLVVQAEQVHQLLAGGRRPGPPGHVAVALHRLGHIGPGVGHFGKFQGSSLLFKRCVRTGALLYNSVHRFCEQFKFLCRRGL